MKKQIIGFVAVTILLLSGCLKEPGIGGLSIMPPMRTYSLFMEMILFTPIAPGLVTTVLTGSVT
ncbi:MAG: hypothetical protein WC865_04230 [Bacteroidales bacterium]